MVSIKTLKIIIRVLYYASASGGVITGGIGILLIIIYPDYGETSSPLKGIIITMIIVRITTSFMAGFGFYAAKKESLVALRLFVASFCVLLVTCVILLIMTGVGLHIIDNTIKEEMYKSLDSYNTKDKTKTFWNDFQKKGECCGVENASDWITKGMTVPESYCNKNSGQKRIEDPLCTGNNKYLHNRGCEVLIRSKMKLYFLIIMCISIGTIIVVAVNITVSACLIFEVKRRVVLTMRG